MVLSQYAVVSAQKRLRPSYFRTVLLHLRWFISIRYFLTHKRQSLVCIAGVTISVTMFIAMTSMMRGLTDKFIEETVEGAGHVTIKDEPRETKTRILETVYKDPNSLLSMSGVKPRDTIKKIRNARGVVAMLDRMPGIEAVAPVVHGNAIATYGTKTVNLVIMGVEPERQVEVTTIGEKVVGATSPASRRPATDHPRPWRGGRARGQTWTTSSASPGHRRRATCRWSASSRPASRRSITPAGTCHQQRPRRS